MRQVERTHRGGGGGGHWDQATWETGVEGGGNGRDSLISKMFKTMFKMFGKVNDRRAQK